MTQAAGQTKKSGSITPAISPLSVHFASVFYHTYRVMCQTALRKATSRKGARIAHIICTLAPVTGTFERGMLAQPRFADYKISSQSAKFGLRTNQITLTANDLRLPFRNSSCSSDVFALLRVFHRRRQRGDATKVGMMYFKESVEGKLRKEHLKYCIAAS